MRSLLLPTALLASLLATPTLACSRVAMSSANGTAAVAGRTMDWPVPTVPDMVAAPVGVERDGGLGPHSLAWTAKHGSLCTWFQGLGCVDGMNDAGLSGALNFLAEGVVATVAEAKAAAETDASTPPLLSATQWLQQALDLYSTVDEVVSALGARPAPYTLTTLTLSTGDKALGHLMFSDKTGASAIVEPTAAGLAVYKSTNASSADVAGEALAVMTNGPFLPAMKNFDSLFNTDNPAGRGLPASDASPDRFVRAAYWRRRTPIPADPASASASVRSIMRTVSSPIGVTASPGSPESCQTQWLSVADSTRGIYLLEPVQSLAVTVVKLADLDLENPATPVRMLETGTRQAELGGTVPLDAWKEVAPASLPGMVGYKGKAAETS